MKKFPVSTDTGVTIANPSSHAATQTAEKHNRYRPEIDGLRAFAVVAVIINHFSKDLLPSGYLGVDLFFVISGYVLTSSLSGRQSKNFGDFIIGFYERRIKRLIPALIVFVLITSLLISFFNPAPEKALKTGIASLFGLSNIYLINNSTDYFAQATELNPFTHTWFLGVQEQFCIIFLLLIWFTGFGRQSKNGSRNLFYLVGILSLASLAGFIYLYDLNQSIAYFSMPTRFWELAAGCILFIGLQKKSAIERHARKIPALFTLSAMAMLMFLPISAAVPATICTVLLAALLISSLKQGTSAFNILTNPKVYYIGLISYSLYLWHWGILSISRWTVGIHWQSIPFQALAIFVIASLSYKYIEEPFRKLRWPKNRLITLLSGLSLIALAGAVIFKLLKTWYYPLYLGARGQDSLALEDGGILAKKCANGNDLNEDKLSRYCTLDSRNGRTIIAVGDSQTGHLLPMLNKLNSDHGFGIKYFTSAGVSLPSLVETRNLGGGSLETFKEKHQRTVDVFEKYMRTARSGDIIILSSRHELRWGEYPVPLSQRDNKFTYYDEKENRINEDQAFEKWQSLVEDISITAQKKRLNLIIFNSIPTFPDPLPDSIENPQWFNGWSNQKYRRLSRKELIANYAPVDDFFKALADKYENTHIFDIFSAVCPAEETLCSADGYLDQWHFSNDGILKVYPAFKSLLSSKGLIPRKD